MYTILNIIKILIIYIFFGHNDYNDMGFVYIIKLMIRVSREFYNLFLI